MKKLRPYFSSFTWGFIMPGLLALSAYTIRPITLLVQTVDDGFLSLVPMAYGGALFALFLSFFLLSLPFFIIFLFTPWFLRGYALAANKSIFLMLHLLAFVAGSVVVYAALILGVGILVGLSRPHFI